MPAPIINENGVQVWTYQELYDELANGFRAIYGQDINLAQDSPDGQRVGIYAKGLLDLQSLGVAIYNNMDPDFARGINLNRISKLAGLFRRAPSQSVWPLLITTDRELTLDGSYTVADEVDQQWILNSAEAVIPANTPTVVEFKAVQFGAVEGLAGAAITQVTVVRGVTSITAPNASSVGQEEETDPQFRQRRARSTRNPGRTILGSLLAKIGNLNGVTDVVGYENPSNATDVELNLGAHSMWFVVEGGDLDEIGEVMAKNKSGGTPLKGSVQVVYKEIIERPSGAPFEIDHLMRFDRPAPTRIYARGKARRLVSDSVIDTGLVEAEVGKAEFVIGEDAVASELYQLGYNASGNFLLFDFEVSEDNINWTDQSLESVPDGKYTLAVEDVAITEVS